MNRLWAYVKQVERRLPRAQRVETVGGLYATLKSRLASVEKELGRTATADEIDALLKAEGEPADVAARLTRAGGQGLVERYLASVVRRLPPEGAHDLIAELREAIGGRLEAREAELGRDADDAEIAVVLREFGHPYRVAARYAGRDHLIGPRLYPWFWPAQQAVVGVVAILGIALALVRAVQTADPLSVVWRGLGAIWEMSLIAFAAVTLAFMLADRAGKDFGFESRWNPRSLPRDDVRKPRSMFESLFSLLFGGIFIAWWVGVVTFPNHWPDREPSVALSFAEVWAPLHTPILLLAILQMAAHASDVIHPAWSRLRSAASIVGHACGLGVLWVLFQADAIIAVAAIDGADGDASRIGSVVDSIVTISLAATGIHWACALGLEIWRQIAATRIDGATGGRRLADGAA